MKEQLKLINKNIIKNTKDEKILRRHLIIEQILNEEKCFSKMNIECAYSVLKDLNISNNNLKSIYTELIEGEICTQ